MVLPVISNFIAMKKFSASLTVVLTLCASASPALSFELPSIFGDGMVLQRDRPIAIFGTGKAGETVRVSLDGQSATATVKDGKWRAELGATKAGGPFVLKVESEVNQKSVQNVMVGEVWVLAGQSNMRWQLGRSVGPIASEAIARADGSVRYFEHSYHAADAPLADVVRGSWTVGDSRGAPEISAVGYYFARALQAKLNVPVGLVQTAVGGTSTTLWIDRDYASKDAITRRILDDYDDNAAREPARIAKAQQDYDAAVEAAKAAGKPIPKKSRRLSEGPRDNTWEKRPGGYYNGRVAPLLPFEARGVIWYQGESNAGTDLPAFQRDDYARHLQTIVTSWRAAAARPNWPFLIVQLPALQNEKLDFATIREQQERAARALPNVGLVVGIDTGEKDDIHPSDKRPIGERLAELGLEVIADGKARTHSPLVKNVEFGNGAALIEFEQTDGGLVKTQFDLAEFIAITRGTAPAELNLNGFELAGADGQWVAASGLIQGERVEVRAKGVGAPTAVRYLWTGYPRESVGLFSKNGNPVAPFRFPRG